MKKIEIEWRHLDKEGNTCERCTDTGVAVRGVVAELSRELHASGFEISFREALLSEHKVSESNLILLNGIPIEEILPNSKKSENCCDSCGEILGAPTLCRTIERGGQTYEAIPSAMIREAVNILIHRQNL